MRALRRSSGSRSIGTTVPVGVVHAMHAEAAPNGCDACVVGVRWRRENESEGRGKESRPDQCMSHEVTDHFPPMNCKLIVIDGWDGGYW